MGYPNYTICLVSLSAWALMSCGPALPLQSDFSSDDYSDRDGIFSQYISECNSFQSPALSGVAYSYYDVQGNFHETRLLVRLTQIPVGFDQGNFVVFRSAHSGIQQTFSLSIESMGGQPVSGPQQAFSRGLIEQAVGQISTQDFINNYYIVLHGVSTNFKAMQASVMNAGGGSAGSMEFLIPSFISDPTAYMRYHPEQQALWQLHPLFPYRFEGLSPEEYYSYAQSLCF